MARYLLLRADGVWDGLSDAVVRPAAVLIEQGRVVAVGSGLAAPSDSESIDLPGCTLLPGLIDMHGHARLNAREGPLGPQVRDDPVRYVLRAVENLQADLRAGVTTVKTNGDRDFLDVGLRAAIAEGLVTGPRLIVATRGIKSPDSTAGIVATVFCRGPEAIRQAVRENLERGADFIKIYVSGGLLEPPEEACRAYYSREEIAAAVEAAAAGGTFVTAHCAGGPTADWCAEAGVRLLEHGYYLTDAQLEKLRRAGTWLDITLGVCFHPEGHAAQAIRQGADPAALAEREARARDTARRAIASGTPFTLGTDGMHGLLVYEVEQVVALGARPVDALRAVTLHAARAMGRSDELGALAPGRLADVFAVEGDPLRDPAALWRVRAVFKEGRRVHG